MVNVIKSELIPHIFEYEVVLFPMGVNNAMNNGFAYELSVNAPKVRESENLSNYGDQRKLGTIHETVVDNTAFCACYIHNGGFHKDKNGSFLDYNHLEACLNAVAKKYKGKKIASIVIGCNNSDGNGDKERILELLKHSFTDCNIDVYDFEEIDYKTKIFKEIAAIHKKLVDKEISGEEFIKQRSEIEWRRKNGIFVPKPDDFVYYPRQEKKKLGFIGKIKK